MARRALRRLPPTLYLHRQLLAWFNRSARDLPWRHRRTPYRVWVSELMLQQTQVATVIPYYERWMRRFPTLEELAKARLPSVLRLWEGLGYYRRARYLHAGARQIVVTLGGRFPSTYEGLRALPGVGPYTAGAIASLALGLCHPVVDGNVERVLLRLSCDTRDPAQPVMRKHLWAAAEALLPSKQPGRWNEALMELGALVCTPVNPNCAGCPLRRGCRARLGNKVQLIPRSAPSNPTRKVLRLAAVLIQRGRALVCQRPESGRLGGLWEFPEVEWDGRGDPAAFLAKHLTKSLGFRITSGPALCTIHHGIMNERVETRFFKCSLVVPGSSHPSCTALGANPVGHKLPERSRPAVRRPFRWRPVASLARVAMPQAHRKAMQQVHGIPLRN